MVAVLAVHACAGAGASAGADDSGEGRWWWRCWRRGREPAVVLVVAVVGGDE